MNKKLPGAASFVRSAKGTFRLPG